MGYVFDASAIFIGFKRGMEEIIAGNYTLNLVVFEIGNAIWKEVSVYKSIPLNKALEILDTISDLLDLMTIIKMDKLNKDILRIAENLGITYYDAAYIYTAKQIKAPLITEDRKLISAAKNKVDIKILCLEDLQYQ